MNKIGKTYTESERINIDLHYINREIDKNMAAIDMMNKEIANLNKIKERILGSKDYFSSCKKEVIKKVLPISLIMLIIGTIIFTPLTIAALPIIIFNVVEIPALISTMFYHLATSDFKMLVSITNLRKLEANINNGKSSVEKATQVLTEMKRSKDALLLISTRKRRLEQHRKMLLEIKNANLRSKQRETRFVKDNNGKALYKKNRRTTLKRKLVFGNGKSKVLSD